MAQEPADSTALVLVVEDEEKTRRMCVEVLQTAGFRVREAEAVPQAISVLEEGGVDIVLSDVSMPGIDGMKLLEMTKAYYPATNVVMMTGFATVASAVEAMRMGAADYVTKPFVPEDLTCRLSRLVERRGMEIENRAMRAQLGNLTGAGKMIGVSPAMREVFKFVMRVAPVRMPVLILGESGTGKELVARAIHDSSPAKEKPFVAVDCGALPENLIERELFGHVRGAFTDARQDQPGLLAGAGDGTLFFDEIGELPIALQAKLLRALQEKEFRPLGSTYVVPLGARVIAATNRDLKEAIAQGGFRADLYYRLNVVSITLPPLRERTVDIPMLAQHFLNRLTESGQVAGGISRQALTALSQYRWPGNVRELENAIQSAALLAGSSTIAVADLPIELRTSQEKLEAAAPAPAKSKLSYLQEIERRAILDVLSAAHGNRIEAARRLGISKSTIYAKIKEYGIVERSNVSFEAEMG